MKPTFRYLQERDQFVSRAKRLLPWLTPARLTYLAYWADTNKIADSGEDIAASVFAPTQMLRLPELRALGRLIWFKPEPPWIERRIPKRDRSGVRVLYIPNVPLKQLHRFVLWAHLHRLSPDRAAYGFERGRSRRDHAKRHCDKSVVVRLDLRKFFPSIDIERVEQILAECGFQSQFRNVLAHLVTYHQRLPQGAPTSPKLADLVARSLDRKLRHLAAQRRWSYSRYADDLSFSCRKVVSSDGICDVIEAVNEIVEAEGFQLNSTKTRVMRRHHRQLVVGAVVNKPLPTAPREKLRLLRAIIHNCTKNGLISEARRYRQQTQDKFGQPKVKEGRYSGEWKRSDRTWAYDKQARFVPRRYQDPLLAYRPEDWTAFFDFWHYLSGLVGEINALDPARGRRLGAEVRRLKLAHVDVVPQLEEDEERIQKFWIRAQELMDEINREEWARGAMQPVFAYYAHTPDAKRRVARSEEGLLAFAVDAFKSLYDSLGNKKSVNDLWEEKKLQDLEFAVELRHHRAHGSKPTGSNRQQKGQQVINEGYRRLFGIERPMRPRQWMTLQDNLCDGLLADLGGLRAWMASQELE